FAQEVGAVTEAEVDAIKARAWKALQAGAMAQVEHQQSQDPVLRFLDLVTTALATGHGHLTLPDGRMPPDQAALGWSFQREFERAIGENDEGRVGVEALQEWRPRGPRLGVLDPDEGLVWFLRDAIVPVVKELAQRGHDPWPLSAEELVRRLHAKGLLAADELQARGTYTVRKRIQGPLIAGLICLLSPDAMDNSW